MKPVLLVLKAMILFVCVSLALAEDLAPELVPVQARHMAQLKSLDAEKAVALTKIKQRYLDELARVERASTAAGKLAEVAAILKEREAVEASVMGPVAPEELPKTLTHPRAEFIAGGEALGREFKPRYDNENADYLRSLAALESRAVNKPELQKQISEEKIKLVNAPATSGIRELTTDFLANSQWNWIPKSPTAGANDWQLLANGKVSTGAAHFWNWKLTGPDQFEIRDGEKVLMNFKMNFGKMEAEDLAPDKNRKETRRIKYGGPIPKGKERKQGQ